MSAPFSSQAGLASVRRPGWVEPRPVPGRDLIVIAPAPWECQVSPDGESRAVVGVE